jgi:hypothetical protein
LRCLTRKTSGEFCATHLTFFKTDPEPCPGATRQGVAPTPCEAVGGHITTDRTHTPFKKIRQTLIENFLPDPAGNFLSAITIAFENKIRFNQTLLEIFQVNLA